MHVSFRRMKCSSSPLSLSSDRTGPEPELPMSVAHGGVVYALDSRIQRQTIPSQDAPLGFSEEVLWSGSLNEDNHPESTMRQVIKIF